MGGRDLNTWITFHWFSTSRKLIESETTETQTDSCMVLSVLQGATVLVMLQCGLLVLVCNRKCVWGRSDGIQANPLFAALASHLVLTHVLAAAVLTQLLACGLRRQWRVAQVLGLLHPCGNPEIPGSWLWTGPAPVIVALWEVNQGLDDFSLSLLFFL